MPPANARNVTWMLFVKISRREIGLLVDGHAEVLARPAAAAVTD